MDWNITNTVTNDSQTVWLWTNAVFNMQITNYWNENLNSVTLTDALSSNCAWALSTTSVWTNTVTFSWMWNHSNNILLCKYLSVDVGN